MNFWLTLALNLKAIPLGCILVFTSKYSFTMKNRALLLLLALITLLGFQASAKKLTALLSHTLFYAPHTGPYLETYLSVSGKSVVFVKNSNGKYQGTIEVMLIFKKDSLIKYSDKYNLLSQEVEDTNKINFNFLDQQRIPLANGDYTFELTIADKNSSDVPFSNSQPVHVEIPSDKVAISGIELLESYKKTETNGPISKSGFDLVPNVNNFYPSTVNSLKFYAEIYNTKSVLQDNAFLVTYYIEEYETSLTLEKFKMFSKQQPKDVNVVMSEFNIENLASGNYNLLVEVRNNKNDLLAFQKLFFQRSSPLLADDLNKEMDTDISNTFVAAYTDSIRLKETIRSFRPIAKSGENNFEDFQLKNASLLLMQRFVYRFWTARDSKQPELAFKNYMEKVERVNSSFKTPIYKGYETDRGRVYLQYGEPNEMIREDREPNTYPYEIWHYYKIKNQTNRKFVFYNRDLVSNDYRLLHSDMAGENFETSWQDILHHGNSKVNDDGRGGTRNFGDRSNENFGNKSSSDFPR